MEGGEEEDGLRVREAIESGSKAEWEREREAEKRVRGGNMVE